MQSLPIDPHLGRIVGEIDRFGAAVVVAPPGAGKTTRIPPELTAPGPVILLQPRRVAARSLARRIAEERGFRLGKEVGWQVRFERRFGPETRLLVATEGILTRRLQDDPLLEGFATVVLDEFHERSIHGDLALALVRQARRARKELRLVVMSATLEAAPVADYLGGCPVIEVPGRPFPVEVDWRPGATPADAARELLHRPGGNILCFLPGAREIARAAEEIVRWAGPWPDVDILPLHGSLDAREQDRALAPSARRKLILATNIAETSLTVDGVDTVVDSGLHKVMRRDPGLGIDRLETERIPADSAEQRAGRAGRTAPGRTVRLWDPRDELKSRREPEILRVDLAGPFLDVLDWGEDPREFEWFEAPREDAAAAALGLLRALGAISSGRITDLGRELSRLPLHPRLARMMIAGGGSAEVVAACAGISEGWIPEHAPGSTDSDLWTIADRIDSAPHRVRHAARRLRRLVRPRVSSKVPAGETGLLRAVLAAYPDRVAQRREPGSPRLRLASGHGAVLARSSGVRNPEFLVAVDLVAGARGPGSAARVRLASGVEAEWLEPTATKTQHHFDRERGVVRAVRRSLLGEIVLAERPEKPDPDVAAGILAGELERRDPDPKTAALLRRLRFAGIEFDLPGTLRRACTGRTSLPRPDLREWLTFDQRRRLESLAPANLAVPSGRRVLLDYRDDGSVLASVKLQELFGLTNSPRIGPEQLPVTFSLLAPNGRPVQTTRDLEGFWERTYPEVRRELRGRYPKHPWPEDPRSAEPTHRTKRRGRAILPE